MHACIHKTRDHDDKRFSKTRDHDGRRDELVDVQPVFARVGGKTSAQPS